MKISIWQQFSSNHSSHFTVIGTFPSALHAELAAREIRSMMRDISAFWHDLSPEGKKEWGSRRGDELTPVEQLLSKLYDVEWPHNWDGVPYSLDWLPIDPKDVPHIIKHLDQYVLIEKYDDKAEEYVNCEPFETLLARWGAELKRDYEERTPAIRVTVTCLAPDDATAETLVNDLDISSPDDQLPPNHREVRIWGACDAILDMNIRRDDRRLVYAFHRVFELGSRFPRFIAYLREHGCMDIEYSFEQD